MAAVAAQHRVIRSICDGSRVGFQRVTIEPFVRDAPAEPNLLVGIVVFAATRVCAQVILRDRKLCIERLELEAFEGGRVQGCRLRSRLAARPTTRGRRRGRLSSRPSKLCRCSRRRHSDGMFEEPTSKQDGGPRAAVALLRPLLSAKLRRLACQSPIQPTTKIIADARTLSIQCSPSPARQKTA